MIREHAAALEELLAAQNLAVYQGGAPDAATVPYAVLWTDSGTRTQEKLPVDSSTVNMLVSVTSVGSTTEQAAWVADRVFAALLDQTPVITGRICQPVTHEVSDPVRRDDDVIAPGGSPVYQQVDVFRLVTRPG